VLIDLQQFLLESYLHVCPVEELNVRTLVFQNESSQDFVELEPLKPLNLSSFTLCLRVATELPQHQREIILFAYRTALGPMQTHLCVTWDSDTGATTVFVDGKKSLTKLYRKNHTVRSGGRVIIGQDPDAGQEFGNFEADQSFVGEISDFNLWSYVVPHSVIKQMATGYTTRRGDIIDWTQCLQVTGDVKLITTNV
uniref:Pentraxin (PTX) domain-containing protein n=1 Tax=Neogobius melanostomus TaxID=47308 RepID=A0A8C6SB50_9GOBI